MPNFQAESKAFTDSEEMATALLMPIHELRNQVNKRKKNGCQYILVNNIVLSSVPGLICGTAYYQGADSDGICRQICNMPLRRPAWGLL